MLNVVGVVSEDPISCKYMFAATMDLGSRSSLNFLKQPPSPKEFGTPLPAKKIIVFSLFLKKKQKKKTGCY